MKTQYLLKKRLKQWNTFPIKYDFVYFKDLRNNFVRFEMCIEWKIKDKFFILKIVSFPKLEFLLIEKLECYFVGNFPKDIMEMVWKYCF